MGRAAQSRQVGDYAIRSFLRRHRRDVQRDGGCQPGVENLLGLNPTADPLCAHPFHEGLSFWTHNPPAELLDLAQESHRYERRVAPVGKLCEPMDIFPFLGPVDQIVGEDERPISRRKFLDRSEHRISHLTDAVPGAFGQRLHSVDVDELKDRVIDVVVVHEASLHTACRQPVAERPGQCELARAGEADQEKQRRSSGHR